MATSRIKNEAGYYHITARGNGKQIIFNEAEDFQRYIDLLEKYNCCLNIEVLAYCLMNNHVHILIYDPEFEMPKLFQNTHSMYTRYFNYKYEREGALFQGRFSSKSITDDKQLLAAFRYVLKNPQEAGICLPKDYMWSSYLKYGENSGLVKTARIEAILGCKSNFEDLINSKDDAQIYHLDDVDENLLMNMTKNKFHLKLSTKSYTFSKRKRDQVILYLRSLGATYKQIVRITGVSYGIVVRVVSKDIQKSNK